jgi:hypothetical protein
MREVKITVKMEFQSVPNKFTLFAAHFFLGFL